MTPTDSFEPLSDYSPHNDIAARIKEAREARGMNRNQLARYLGTSWALVNQWETGKTIPSLKSLQRIAKVLEVDADRLVGQSHTSSSPEFDEFLKQYLPNDLSKAEEAWLRSAPCADRPLSPDAYSDILRALRANRHGWDESHPSTRELSVASAHREP